MTPRARVHETSIATLATERARRTVALALVITAVLLLAATLERYAFPALYESETQTLIEIHQTAARIRLLDERLTTSTQMAAATGDSQWIVHHQVVSAAMEEAIRAAVRLAPMEEGDAQASLKNAIRHAHGRLTALDREVLRAAKQGQFEGASALLNSPEYASARDALDAATEAFLTESSRETVAGLDRAETGYHVGGFTGLFVFLICAGWLWWQLKRWLHNAETAQIDAEERIRQLAMRDVLTGLPNRRAMHESLRAMMSRSKRRQSSTALMVIDLDRFKPINDHHGHLIGDLVLKEVARRLNEVLRDDEIRARFGGDEFVAAIEVQHRGRRMASKQVADRIIEALSAPMTFDNVTVHIGASIGMAFFPEDAQSEDELVRRADLALYAVKEAGRGKALHYSAEMDETADETAELEVELPEAVQAGEIVPFFQPLIDLATSEVQGFEVLARWQHPDRGLIPPDRFVPIAERSGFIAEMTTELLRAAARHMRGLPPTLTMAINIAPQQIQRVELVAEIVGALAAEGFPPSRLEVELTENALVTDLPAAQRVISAFKSHGVRIALDDFGTGYSSLCYLSELPIDKIKIDQSFMRSLHHREESLKVVNAIIALGESLGVPTLAEGIENQRDAEVLQELGCASGQGYYYSRPIPGQQLASYLATSAPLGTEAANTDVSDDHAFQAQRR